MKYRHIFFDLDHTLWDFERNSAESLQELYHQYKLQELGTFQVQELVDQFSVLNRTLWDLYDTGKITQEELRALRFQTLFKKLGLDNFVHCQPFGDKYVQLCPSKPHLIPFAKEVLEYLRDKYVLHIITNGFVEVQSIKLQNAGLLPYFQEVITSDRAGNRKPHRQIFDFAMQICNTSAEECMMVGDNLETDIRGARNAGMDHIYYNPEDLPEELAIEYQPTYHVRCLSELMEIL